LRGVRSASVLLAVIGSRWHVSSDTAETRGRDRDVDWVEREIAEALKHQVRVIPVLVGDTQVPAEVDLPIDIRPLARCQYVRLHHRNVDYDVARLVDELVDLIPALAEDTHVPVTGEDRSRTPRHLRRGWLGPAGSRGDASRSESLAVSTGRLPPRYIHGVPLPRNWADRDEDVVHFRDILMRADVRVLNIVAIGGTGKTTLTRKITEQVTDTPEGFDSLIWFSFYREDDVEQFFLEACRYLTPGFDSSEYTSTFERAALLQALIESRKTLFVLDGFERLVASVAGRSTVGRVSRREISSFLGYVLSSRSRSTVVLTSRVRLDEFADAKGYLEEELPDLRLQSAVNYLRAGGSEVPTGSSSTWLPLTAATPLRSLSS
jgi:NB-ARC domain